MISKIQIKNYKSIHEIELDLSGLNIFIGANGAGKSNLISFFRMLRALYNQKLQHYIGHEGSSDNILYYGIKVSKFIEAKIFFDNTNFYEFRLEPDASNQLFFSIEQDGYNKNYIKPNSLPSWHIETTGEGFKESDLITRTTKRYHYIRSHFSSFHVYHFHDTGFTSAMKQKCSIDDNGYLKEDAANLASFLFLLRENHISNYNLIIDTIRSIAPFFGDFDLKPDSFKTDMIQLEWKEKESDKYFNAHNLSDGTLRFICLAALLLQPILPQTIIIDEPELGLHPSAINKLAAMIKSASEKSQLIISTQSTNLLNQFCPQDIIVVNRLKKETTFNRLGSEALSEWLSDYSIGEIWEKNLIGGKP